MKKMKKSLLFAVVTAVLMLGFVFGVSALEPTGQCGDNVYYTLDYAENGYEYERLTISGTGDMWDYNVKYNDDASPWQFCSFKEVIIDEGVTSIGECAFYGVFISDVILPDSLVEIDDYAFAFCEGLENIIVGKGLERIGTYAFYNGLDEVESLSLPYGVKEIGEGAFEGNWKIELIEIPDTVTTIERRAFAGCALTEASLPNNLIKISDELFYACIKIENIVIPGSVTEIGNSAFAGCWNLKSIVINSNVKSVGEGAFSGCQSLSDVIFEDGVESIGRAAFFGCENIVSINLPKSVKKIGPQAFSGCYNLRSITVDANNKYFSADENGVLYNKDKTVLVQCPPAIETETFNIPEGIVEISDSAFNNCVGLSVITIPDGMKTIGAYAFGECKNITKMVIPEGVIALDDNIFGGCTNLVEVTIPSTVAPSDISHSLCGGCTSLKDVYYNSCEGKWRNLNIYIEGSVNIHYIEHNGYCDICGEGDTANEPADIPESKTFIEKIKDFFNSIIEWFKNLFKFWS